MLRWRSSGLKVVTTSRHLRRETGVPQAIQEAFLVGSKLEGTLLDEAQC